MSDVAGGARVPGNACAGLPPTPAPADADADETIIDAVLAGDVDRFGLLVMRHERHVTRFILKYERNFHDAQDLVQEAFLQAYRALPGFDRRSRFSTWLVGIAFNLLKNHISRTPARRYAHEDLDDHTDLPGAPADCPERAAGREQLLEAMDRAVADLSAEMRDAMLLVAGEGMGYEAAAATLGVPIGTLKSRLCRARMQLAEALREYRGG